MRTIVIALACVCVLASATPLAQRAAPTPTTANPVMLIETAKGTVEIELFAAEAPKSVQHLVELVKRNFYRGQRVHRVERSLVQFGDPSTRDMSQMQSWGSGNSGNPIGVAEFSKRPHVRGVVGLAHGGNPKNGDSQIYIMKTANPALNGVHVIVGRVTKGMDIVDKLEKADPLRRVALK